MKNLLILSALSALLMLASCRKCSIESDLVVPDQSIRIVNAQGDDLVFGPNAIYQASEIKFIHEKDGEMPFATDSNKQLLYLEFPATAQGAEDISLVLDSVTTHTLTYNTLVYTNNECTKDYVLSYVKLDGEQVCGSCGDRAFNPDPVIYLEL